MNQSQALNKYAEAVNTAYATLLVDLGEKPSTAKITKSATAADRSDAPHTWNWDPSKLKWEPRAGPKVNYEYCKEPNNVDYQNLVADLKAHQNNINRGGWHYWLFDKGDEAVGRNQKESKN